MTHLNDTSQYQRVSNIFTLKGSTGTVSKKDLVDDGNIRLDNLIMTSAETVKLSK